MLHRRVRERVRTVQCRVIQMIAVHPVDLFGAAVVRLQILVLHEPGGRRPVLVRSGPEILTTESSQRRTVELRVSTDVVVRPGAEGLAVRVVPGLGVLVAPLAENRSGFPILPLVRQVVPTLDEQHPGAGILQCVGERAAAHPAADDDDVVTPAARASPGDIGWTVNVLRIAGRRRMRHSCCSDRSRQPRIAVASHRLSSLCRW